MENYILETVGKLSRHPEEIDDWLISKKIPIPCLDNEELNFTFFIYDFKDDNFSNQLDLATQNFLNIDKM